MSQHSQTLLLFGATGDLSRRMLLPSLYALHSDELIAPGLRIFGTARSDHDDDSFRAFAKAALCEFLPDDRKDEGKIDAFLTRLRYQALLAGRQFNRVDPDNRLVAAELERRWETTLRDLRQAEKAAASDHHTTGSRDSSSRAALIMVPKLFIVVSTPMPM